MIDNSAQGVLRLLDYCALEDAGYRQATALSDCLIVAHLHVLDSTHLLFNRLSELGLCMSRVILAPKAYSTVVRVRQKLQACGVKIIERPLPEYHPDWYDWYSIELLKQACAEAFAISKRENVRRVILIDDGGLLTDEWWRLSQESEVLVPECISVQQTASGFFKFRKRSRIPKIDVARSAAKKYFESKIITDGIIEKIKCQTYMKDAQSVGVVGLGALGSRLASALIKDGREVFVYDADRSKTLHLDNECMNWEECFHDSDVIFGCTGRNFSFPMHTPPRCGAKTLVSLSSRDVEFKAFVDSDSLSLSTRYADQRHFDELNLEGSWTGPFNILNGGFPVNFDRVKEWETTVQVALTRGLVLLGVLQATCAPANKSDGTVYGLNLSLQRTLVNGWLKSTDIGPDEFGVTERQIEDLRWWKSVSPPGHIHSGRRHSARGRSQSHRRV